MLISPATVQQFPLIPGGGMFFLPVGMCIVLGALVPRIRMLMVWSGFALGVLAIAIGAPKYLIGLPAPSVLQVASFALAIAVEIAAFRTVLPRVRPHGERTTTVATLAIVGAHFLIMIPAFGWPIVALAVLCLANASAAWRLPAYPLSAAWFIDGIFKIAIGGMMWLASPVLQH